MSLLLLLVGCYPVETYRDDHDAAICAWKATCYEQDDAACVAAAKAARQDAAPGCEYQPDKARECVDGLDELACAFDTDTGNADSGEEVTFGFPSACEAVWDCP